MTDWIQGPYGGLDVNLVFARGMTLGALAEGLRGVMREPLASGEAGGWAWVVHEMLNAEAEDFEPVNYSGLCPGGAEIVVFVTEPCSPKGFPPAFEYHRDGRTVLWFSFEDLGQRVGDNPDYLSAELLAAGLIGPDAVCAHEDEPGHDCYDHDQDDEERLVRTLADFFALPSPPLSPEVTPTWTG